MHGKFCFLFGGMLITLSALATPDMMHTGSDSLRPVVISGKQIRSESSRQGVQHSRMVKTLQPESIPVLAEKKKAPDSSHNP